VKVVQILDPGALPHIPSLLNLFKSAMILFGMGCSYSCGWSCGCHGFSVTVVGSSLELGATTWSVQQLHHHQNLCDTGSAVRQYATFNTGGKVVVWSFIRTWEGGARGACIGNNARSLSTCLVKPISHIWLYVGSWSCYNTLKVYTIEVLLYKDCSLPFMVIPVFSIEVFF
jgi:hypothetical protein